MFGLEIKQREIQATDGEIAQQEAPQAAQSVGSLLKRERARLGLSREQITETTRMRTKVVEAIEDEDWDSLPPPVFVRGFLRAYAQVVGVSQEKVIDLYTKSVPPESPGLKPRLEPSMGHRRRRGVVFFGLILLIAVYGLWHFYLSSQVGQGSLEIEKRDQGVPWQPVPADKEVSSAPFQPGSASSPPVRAPGKTLNSETGVVQGASQDPPFGQQVREGRARDQADDGDGGLSLTGIVKERTWVRIRIDGKEEKEYLFQAGSRPQWRGREGFYILIGNAAGIDFDLNGKRVGNLGNPGQVIRLTLPKEVGLRERAN